MEKRTVKTEEDMVALAEELAAKVPVRRGKAASLPPWASYALSALAGAGAVGLWWALG